MQKKTTHPLAIAAIAFVGILFVGSLARTNNQEPHSSVHAVAAEPIIKVMVSRQDPEGVTEAQMSNVFLNNLEQYTVERVKEKVRDHYQARGLAPPELNVRSESNYIEVQGKKLGIVRMFYEPGNSAMIVGFSDGDLVRVNCQTDLNYQVEVSTGECAQKILEVFGVSFAGDASNNSLKAGRP